MLVEGTGDLVITEQSREESPSVSQASDSGTSLAITFEIYRRAAPTVTEAAAALGHADIWNAFLHVPRYNAATHTISRQMPMCLYDIPWLFATKITNCHGIGPALPSQPPRGGRGPIARGNANDNFAPMQDGYRMFYNARHITWRATVLFETASYDILPDSPGMKEYHRYTEKLCSPSVECLIRRQGQYYFKNGPMSAFPAQGGGTVRQSFPMGLHRRVAKSTHTWTWFAVPARAVMLASGVISPNLLGGLGRINHRPWPPPALGDPAFRGPQPAAPLQQPPQGLQPLQRGNPTSSTSFPRNSLLLTQLGFKPTEAAASPLAIGCLPGSTMSRCWNISFIFSEFDPPMDPTPAGAAYQYAGHQLIPDASNSGNSPAYWYEATSSPKASDDPGRPLYEEYDFNMLFTPL